jgi:hypothetical protein
VNGANKIDTENTLFSTPSLQGYNAILQNIGENETILNLETLFNATLENPGKINALFIQ